MQKFCKFAHLKPTFSILHFHFYKTLTSVCLLYIFIQIKYSFLCHTATDPHPQSTPTQPPPSTHPPSHHHQQCNSKSKFFHIFQELQSGHQIKSFSLHSKHLWTLSSSSSNTFLLPLQFMHSANWTLPQSKLNPSF